MPSRNLLIWSEDEVEARSDGFLLLKKFGTTDEQQPLLLHSTELFLECLYPKMDRESIFKQKGHMGDQETLLGAKIDEGDSTQVTEEETKAGNDSKAEVSPEYRPYQNFVRAKDLGNRIQSALLDIQLCRHRFKRQDEPRIPRAEAKVRALEMQQKLLSQRSEGTGENSGDDMESDSSDDEGDNNDAIEAEEDENHAEPGLVRLVRTVNSIRAIFPFLLPILNHPRKFDNKLQLKGASWNAKKRRPMCWLLGATRFDTTSKKLCQNSLRDVKVTLRAYIQVQLAEEISQDPLGAPNFWSKMWLQEVRKRSLPEIFNPLLLLTNNSKQETAEIETVARQCDEHFLSTNSSENDTPIQKDYNYAINQVRDRILTKLQHMFPQVRISIYGSCLSNLSLGKGSDVDLSLWIPEVQELKDGFQEGHIDAGTYEREMKKFVYKVHRKLQNKGKEFRNLQPITRARVPVIKGTMLETGNPYSNDGSINFDICFLNDIAVANSGLLREYSLVDPRVRSLMMAVKKWAKEMNINSAKDNTISSYAWINLVIFYLQCINFVPNLQSRKLVEEIGIPNPNPDSYWNFVNKLDTFFLKWSQVEQAGVWERPAEYAIMPVSLLLYGFFEFYSQRFPLAMKSVSIKTGNLSLSKLAFRKVSIFFSIEDCFETYESHCPHDLGTPAGEDGARKIIDFLYNGKQHLEDILLGKVESKNWLWPQPHLSDCQPSKQSKKRGGRSKKLADQATGVNQNAGETTAIKDQRRNEAKAQTNRNRRRGKPNNKGAPPQNNKNNGKKMNENSKNLTQNKKTDKQPQEMSNAPNKKPENKKKTNQKQSGKGAQSNKTHGHTKSESAEKKNENPRNPNRNRNYRRKKKENPNNKPQEQSAKNQ